MHEQRYACPRRCAMLGGRGKYSVLCVVPFKGKPRAKIAVVMPTFTYVIYQNNARPEWTNEWRKKWVDRTKEWGGYPHNPGDHPESSPSSRLLTVAEQCFRPGRSHFAAPYLPVDTKTTYPGSSPTSLIVSLIPRRSNAGASIRQKSISLREPIEHR